MDHASSFETQNHGGRELVGSFSEFRTRAERLSVDNGKRPSGGSALSLQSLTASEPIGEERLPLL